MAARVRLPDKDALDAAAQALRRGELVVFPTETVYGVGANALDAGAVARIFQAKGRPADNPVIVHVADVAAARRITREWPTVASVLSARFWPGPLTLVLQRSREVSDIVTAGLDSVAVRAPNHPVAQALLRSTGLPIAAPSANRSGRPSPTRVEDALEDLGTAVALYLDGGPTRIGVESTVLDVREARPRLLRSGGVTQEAIEAVVGPIDVGPVGDVVRSPGLRHRHYAPKARLHLHGPGDVARVADELRSRGGRVAIVAGRETLPESADTFLPGGRHEPEAWAATIFTLLRELDRRGYEDVVIELIPPTGLGAAVQDRLRRAAER